MAKNSKCTEKERQTENSGMNCVTNLHSEDQNVINTVSHLLATKKQIKRRLCGLRSCLWQEAQEISLHVKSQSLFVSVSAACTHNK